MTLNEYLEGAGITEVAFAAAVGLSQSQVNRLRHGESKPSWEAVVAIEKATKGKVQARDLGKKKKAA